MNGVTCAKSVGVTARREKSVWLRRIQLAAGVSVAPGTMALRADDDKKQEVDCKETDLGFSAPDYTVTCEDLGKTTMDVDGTFGARKTDKLEAESDADQTFLIVIDNRPIGPAVAGFEVKEFQGESDEGSQMDCIGFRHQGARPYDGIARLVAGLACSTRGRARSYAALEHLEAPGS